MIPQFARRRLQLPGCNQCFLDPGRGIVTVPKFTQPEADHHHDQQAYAKEGPEYGVDLARQRKVAEPAQPFEQSHARCRRGGHRALVTCAEINVGSEIVHEIGNGVFLATLLQAHHVHAAIPRGQMKAFVKDIPFQKLDHSGRDGGGAGSASPDPCEESLYLRAQGGGLGFKAGGAG